MIEGGCLCGAVRFTASEPPKTARICWCRVCQYLGAGSGTAGALFAADAVTLTGELRYFDSTADSGNAMRRGFCPTCGTPITTGSLARPDLIGLRLGTFDDPGSVAPQSTIWTDSAPEWACIDPDLPREPKQPPPLA